MATTSETPPRVALPAEAGTGHSSPARPGVVRRRHVLYLAGFDPQGPAQYHALYRREAQLQAPVGGYTLEVGPRQRAGPHSSAWDVSWRSAAVTRESGREAEAACGTGAAAGAGLEGAQPAVGPNDACEVLTRYEMLRWDDLVRAHWPSGQWAAIRATAWNSWQLTRNGSFWRFLHISWPAVLALSLPGLLLAGVVAAGLALVWAVASLAASGHGIWAGALGLVAGAGLFQGARFAQARMYMGWLMRSTRVVLKQARGELPELEHRLDRFAERVLELAQDPEVDELLVVGHSSGAMLAASVMARALQRDPALSRRKTHVSLMTLGHCMPLLSCQPEAATFREELQTLRGRGTLAWVDFSAPADGCCSALTDPTRLHMPTGRESAGLAATAALAAGSEASGAGPKLLSPRFNKLFTPSRYAQVRRDKYRCHFQYLMATELAGDYDYFAITTGPIPLSIRYERHASIDNFDEFRLFGGLEDGRLRS